MVVTHKLFPFCDVVQKNQKNNMTSFCIRCWKTVFSVTISAEGKDFWSCQPCVSILFFAEILLPQKSPNTFIKVAKVKTQCSISKNFFSIYFSILSAIFLLFGERSGCAVAFGVVKTSGEEFVDSYDFCGRRRRGKETKLPR